VIIPVTNPAPVVTNPLPGPVVTDPSTAPIMAYSVFVVTYFYPFPMVTYPFTALIVIVLDIFSINFPDIFLAIATFS